MSTACIELLTKENYKTWCIETEALLVKNGTWGYVTGSKPKPAITGSNDAEKVASQALQDAWIEDDLKVKFDLTLCLNPSDLKQIEDCKTSKEVWEKLSVIYSSKDPTSKATLLKQLLLNKMNDGDDVKEYLNKFFDVVNKLKAMGIEYDFNPY